MANPEGPFRPVVGLPGKLYVPRPAKQSKHPCADCFSCQWCGDTRCAPCRAKCPDLRADAPDRGPTSGPAG